MIVWGQIVYSKIGDSNFIAVKGIETDELFLLSRKGEKTALSAKELAEGKSTESKESKDILLKQLAGFVDPKKKLELKGILYEGTKKEEPAMLSIESFRLLEEGEKSAEISEIPDDKMKIAPLALAEKSPEVVSIHSKIVDNIYWLSSFDPTHILSQREKLKLTPQQEQKLNDILQELKEAKAQNEGVISHCSGEIREILERKFELAEKDEVMILHELEEVNEAEAALRVATVKAHLKAWKILIQEQRKTLRGSEE